MKRLLLLSLILLAACGDDKAAREPTRPVLHLVVEASDLQRFGRFAGTIEARYETTLSFRINGRIASRLVDVGDSVSAGQVLATLDPTDQQNQLRESQAELASAEARLIDTRADARRQEEMFARGVGAKAALDQARTTLESSQARVKQLRSSVVQSRDQLGYTRLQAEFNGLVTSWQAEVGQVVTSGQGVVTLARPEVREAVFDLPDELLEHLPADARFRVVAQLDPTLQTSGVIREISPQADAATRTRRLRLTLDQPPAAFHLGTTVSVELNNPISDAVSLPATVLLSDEHGSAVWLIDREQATVQRHPVQLLQREGEQVILKGVRPGQWIVRAGVNSLRDGQTIRLPEDASR